MEGPQALELLAACLAAGLPARTACSAVVQSFDGPVADDLGQVLSLMELGVADVDAWRVLDDHPQLGLAAADLARSVESGTSMVEGLQHMPPRLARRGVAPCRCELERSAYRTSWLMSHSVTSMILPHSSPRPCGRAEPRADPDRPFRDLLRLHHSRVVAVINDHRRWLAAKPPAVLWAAAGCVIRMSARRVIGESYSRSAVVAGDDLGDFSAFAAAVELKVTRATHYASRSTLPRPHEHSSTRPMSSSTGRPDSGVTAAITRLHNVEIVHCGFGYQAHLSEGAT